MQFHTYRGTENLACWLKMLFQSKGVHGNACVLPLSRYLRQGSRHEEVLAKESLSAARLQGSSSLASQSSELALHRDEGWAAWVTLLCLLQGILGVFMREPLLDWQREGRMLKDPKTDNSLSTEGAADMHIAAKVCMLLLKPLLQAASNTLYTMIMGSSSLLGYACHPCVMMEDS